MVSLERFQVDSRLIIKSVAESDRVQKRNILVTFFVFAEQNEVVEFCFSAFYGQIVANVKFRSDNRLYAFFLAGVEKVHRAVHVSVVGYGERGHSESLGFFRRDGYFRRAVEYAVFRMNV